MENAPAIFAGSVFALFGGALLLWTGTRLRQRLPVAEGVARSTSVAVATSAGVTALMLAVWCFSGI
ncbi:hypothetical protein GT204_07625 [Streptomyces sp. SID4919]|uniref:Uncharacterized protein n=1 Tax=Streptomyces uncialis TaxID=1048205 RepID=A0A1Q4UY47_9ACTN|nr:MULTISPECIES: hypothetical protein [Streptomyces]MCX4664688.1 hypothetical protein [Streptomyces uncialis]MYY08776.1 hypothetical protein [Streptomyces sp. SID4919]OKH90429.1 hypothetical protein AB852_35240 [Streptomyces uncialis]WST69703.1 hypothetical protein OG268_20880 [Streptomyces uncialis]WTE11671.1 hypothetical protein OG924_16175 [Streptomyces uncialis]